MKVLITSGGTKIPIDSVRSITNMSKGTFGSQIAEVFYKNMRNEDELIFLYAKDSKTPNTSNAVLPRDRHIQYETFWEYNDILKKLLLKEQPDIVILAAAVSDYECEQVVDGKIRTKDELIIKLKPLPKVISEVRDLVGDKVVICGFKLLVNSTEDELRRAAAASIRNNRLDFVIANDLSTIKDTRNHSLHVMGKDYLFYKYIRKNFHLPTVVYNFCTTLSIERNHE